MILTRSIMLVAFIPMVLAVDISLHGANNVWISSNVRSLGCYSPFEPSLYMMQTITNQPDQIDLTNCNYCGLSDFVLVRGAQCTCINNDIVANQMSISDTYCNIPCDQDPYYDGDQVFMCGGNLGGSLYCNKQSGNDCLNANFNATSVDIYRDFGSDRSGDFQSLEPCLNLGCGSRPSSTDLDNLSYVEYFPDLNPEDCVVFCTFVNTSYAHAGWQTREINGNIDLYPMCICSNITMPPDPEGLPCMNGTCPSIFDPVDQLDSSCGNKQTVNDNWSVYCTTMVVTSEVNGTTSCAPYQPMPLTNDSLESCWASLTSTEGIKSSIPVTPEEKCAFGRKSKGVNLVKDGMKFECSDDCPTSNCCKCGNCGNVTSCSFNGSCYDISSDSSDSNNGTVDTWRTILADKCTKDHPGGHLVAIDSQSEHEFISQILSQASEEKSPVLSSGIHYDDGEFWVLSDSQRFPISEDAENWGVKINRDECDISPCYLMLVFNDEKYSIGYNVWEFTRCSDSFLFVCEYHEPERSTVTPSTTSSTTSTTTQATTTQATTTQATTTQATTTKTTTKSTTCIASTSSPTTNSITETTSSSTTTETTSVTTNQPVTTTLNPNLSYENCPCNSTDMYDIHWIINANETKYQSCRQGANGQASWTCDLINDYGCRLRTQQPDFSNCQSLELVEISENVQEANNETELYVVWESLRNFTSRLNTYFGHEIDNILDIVIDILNQQDWQMNGTKNHLEFQINTTQSGARIIDNLISHSAQWEQLTSQDDRSQKALLLLNVSEDMSFRLTDIAEQDNRSLRCEIYLANITFSSAYWNGNQTRVDDCDLDSDQSSQSINDDIAGSEIFRRFPISDQISDSYLLLPEGTIENHRTHKGAGLLISHYILQLLFPGQNNIKNDQKNINSPLISYTLRNYDSNDQQLINNQIPKGTLVELVYRHGQLAKDPPVRILHRSLNPGETPSAVIGSSFCTFLSFNQSSYEGNQITSWIWDGQGCTLKSTNRTHTVCQCNHLTGFASLMDFHDYTGESRPLEITSIICSLASAISLAITFIVLTALRSIKTDRTIITQNLCIFLMFSHVMALTTLNRHYLNLDQVTCAAMGIMLHFSLLVSFMWMAIEGLRLCRMVLYVFNLRDWTLYYVLAAYIVPFIIVSVTVLTAEFTTTIISAYTGDETCWLNGPNYKWSFAGPVAVIILVNLIFAMIAVRSSWNLKQNTDRSLEEKIRNAAALLLSLTCLLGISWLTGFLLYAETQVFAYIFTITNGLQGVTIMLFRCFLNDEVRTAIKDRWRRHRNNRIGRWSSTMTTNTSSQRRQSVDADSKLKANMKLSQTNSQSSVLSSATKTTDASFITSALTNQNDRRQRNVRTFSGTEFSDEYSSEMSESFSSASNTSYRHHPEKKEQSTNNDGRRVSFFIQQNTTPLPSLPDISSSHNSSETSLVSRRSANQYFYEQDPSAFF